MMNSLTKPPAAVLVILFVALTAPAQTLTTLASFDGTNGMFPQTLTVGADGNFYGLTQEGGAYGNGTIFQLATNNVLTLLMSFDGTNGAWPVSALTLAPDGSLYGGTANGGMYNVTPTFGPPGDGTIFQITTNGMFTSLHSFDGTNGAQPRGGVVFGLDGNLYGTTVSGGVYEFFAVFGEAVPGTVFQITPNGLFTSLVCFDATNNGEYPRGMVLGDDGAFYGVNNAAYHTGSSGYTGDKGDGRAYRVTTNGVLTEIAALPYDGSAGADVTGRSVMGPDGNLYGVGLDGGEYNHGTVFRVTLDGILSLLVSFNGTNGAMPYAGLTLGPDGIIYGATYTGGAYNLGTLFGITTNGSFTTLYSFDGTNGAEPFADLTVGNDGNLYGGTDEGGPYNSGTLFRFTVPAQLYCQNVGAALVLTWSKPGFALQSAPSISDTYTNIPNATSPYTNTVSGPQQFFRLVGQ